MAVNMDNKVDITNTDAEDVDVVDVDTDVDTDAVVAAEVTVEGRTNRIDGTGSPVTTVVKLATSVGSATSPVEVHTEWRMTQLLTSQGWMSTPCGAHPMVMNPGNAPSTMTQLKHGAESVEHMVTT